MSKMNYLKNAESFIAAPSYRDKPYSSRGWGGKWHSLCSYQGKLKPAIAHFLIKSFTCTGDIVLDPLCGVGTIPLEACRQGRIGIGNDLSQLAYCVTKAKIESPEQNKTLAELESLRRYIEDHKGELDLNNLPYASFGFNKTMADYFEKKTFAEIILARNYFSAKFEEITPEQALVMSSIMHILHGNRPYALSRHSHPLTPYAPQGKFEYKNLIDHTQTKILATFKEPLPETYKKGSAILGDCQNIKGMKVDAIITSPPFAGSLKFYMQNWMRLWFSGWDENDFSSTSRHFYDAKQDKDMSIYRAFFEMCNLNLKNSGIVVLHLGKNSKIDMASELITYANEYFKVVYCANEDVSCLEKHGIKDKGGTTDHQFLFLEKR